MRTEKIAAVFVGADRIAKQGDTANKIGTYALAIMAKHHDVPFYVVAPSTTLDPRCTGGDAIIIEQRAAAEVQGLHLPGYEFCWSPKGTAVFNPSFDVTDAELITGYILDSGYYSSLG